MSPRYYRRDGTPYPGDGLLEWGRDFEDRKLKIVKQENIGDVLVSTVWLGLDHGWGRGSPLIFETMVFRGDDSGDEQERYSMEEEALAGHERIASRYRKETDERKG